MAASKNTVSSSIPWQIAFGTPRQTRFPRDPWRFLVWHQTTFLPSLRAKNARQKDGEKNQKKLLTEIMTSVKQTNDDANSRY